VRSHKWSSGYAAAVSATIEPEPSEAVREAILGALAEPETTDPGWAAAALLEGVEDAELDP
jgi:hypothetical protein